MAGQMQEAGYEELLGEDNGKKKRITFIGAFQGDLKAGEEVIVSFPGVHGAAWEFLTEKGSPIQTTCVFLPDLDDDKKNGAGKHSKTGNEGDKCYCYSLYGKKKDHGCAWYHLWRRKTMQALLKGCCPVVVTQLDGGLGTSQKGEVEFLERNGFVYYKMNIKEFVILHHPDAPPEEQWNLRIWTLGARRENCEAAIAHNKQLLHEIRINGQDHEYARGSDAVVDLPKSSGWCCWQTSYVYLDRPLLGIDD